MIPWYWLIVAAAVPSFFVGVLWIALKDERAFGGSMAKSVDFWVRHEKRATRKLARIRDILNETEDPETTEEAQS